MSFSLQKLCTICLIAVGVSELQAQTAITSSGGTATGTGGTISISVGQLFQANSTSNEGSLSEGILQSFEISLMTETEDDGGMGVSIYPNPTNGALILKVPEQHISLLTYQLYDVNGNPLQGKPISDIETNIDMSNLSTTTYFLRVSKTDKEFKVFKIIKK